MLLPAKEPRISATLSNDRIEASLAEFAHQAGSQRREAADITGALDALRVINRRQSEAFRHPAD